MKLKKQERTQMGYSEKLCFFSSSRISVSLPEEEQMKRERKSRKSQLEALLAILNQSVFLGFFFFLGRDHQHKMIHV